MKGLLVATAMLLPACIAGAQDPRIECNRAIENKELDRVPGLALEIVSKKLTSGYSENCMATARIVSEAALVPDTIKACDELYARDKQAALLNQVCNDTYRTFGVPGLR